MFYYRNKHENKQISAKSASMRKNVHVGSYFNNKTQQQGSFFNHRTFCKYKAVRFWLIFVLYLELYGAFKDFFNVFGHFA